MDEPESDKELCIPVPMICGSIATYESYKKPARSVSPLASLQTSLPEIDMHRDSSLQGKDEWHKQEEHRRNRHHCFSSPKITHI